MITRPTLETVRRAASRISQMVRRTPLERSRWLSSQNRNVFLKFESLQTTGSFKLRGSAAKLTSLSGAERAKGILTVSAGNHGLAVSYCADALNLDATVVVPESASQAKVDAIRRYSVKLIKRGAGYDEAERAARQMEKETGLTFISPYNDPEVIAGQGTVALEIFEDLETLGAIVVPIGGGGLIAGVAIAAKSIKPGIKVFGVEPEASPTMTAALNAGKIVEISEDPTIADGLAGNVEPDSITFPIIQELVDDVLLVSERDIRESLARIAGEDHLIIEGSAAAPIAALAKPQVQHGDIAAVITGRNITMRAFAEVIKEFC